MGDLTANFDRKEFACKCGCGRDNISMNLVDQLQRLRVLYGKPLGINRGCSCIQHNKDVGGVPDSAHICEGKDGEAADIHIPSPDVLWVLVNMILSWKLFNRIGIGKTLIHVDVSTTLPQNCIWVYTDK